MGRPRTLERMGLEEEADPGRWQIDTGLEARLRRMGERGDIIKTTRRELVAASLLRAAGDHTIFDSSEGGRMLTLNSGRFILIEGTRDFALVPWRPVLERVRGQLVTGAVGGEGISWSIGWKRGLGP